MRRRAPAAIVLALVLLAPIVAACRAKSEPAPAAHTDYFTKCAGCHLADYQSARDHVGKRPTMCPVCHSQEDWHPLEVLDHPWQLTGAHEGKDCFKCHTATPPVFAGTSKECVGCHRKEYDGAPYHAKLPTNCQKCHETSAWKPALWIDEAAWEPEPEPAASQAPAPPASSSAAPVASHPPAVVRTAPTTKPTPTATTTPTTSAAPTTTTTPTATAAPTSTRPDVVVGPSRRR